MPSDQEVASLREQVQELLTSIIGEESLSEDARSILLDYAHRLAWALDHLHIVGPDAVRGATERLACRLADLPSDEADEAEKKASVVMRAVWNLFMKGQQIYAALQGWGDLGGDALNALPPGNE